VKRKVKTTLVMTLGAMLVLTQAALGTAAVKPLTPQALYTALLTKAYANSELPTGFSSAKVSLSNPSSQAKTYHIVGEVTVAVHGPDPDDGLVFYVFRDAAGARADLAHPNLSGGTKVHIVGKVPGYTLPSVFVTGSITGKNALGKTITNGVTGVFVATGNVIAGAFTDSADNTDSGNVPAALSLLKSGLNHLKAITARKR
jgi:hypothetical protein